MHFSGFFAIEIFTWSKIIELEWVEHGGHKMVAAVTEHYNNIAWRGTVTKSGTLWIAKTIASMVAYTRKGGRDIV